jgi:ubiquinone/menaquinone biosynthesis C-methylase UbiE
MDVQPMSTKEAVTTAFSERANEWAANYAHAVPPDLSMKNLRTRQRFALELIEAALPRGSRILDAGCGPGEMAAKLMMAGYEVWGVDVAGPMIEHARRLCGTERFQVADIERIPFPDHSFDGVVCLGVIEYLDSDTAALREIRRVLKPGGTAVLSTPSAICPLYRIDRMLSRLTPAIDLLSDVLRYRLRRRPVPVRLRVPPLGHRTYHRHRWLRRLRSEGLHSVEWLCYGWGWYTTRLGVLIEGLSHKAAQLRQVVERHGGSALLHSAGSALSRNVVVNWVGYEQLVRLRAVADGERP